MKKYASLIFAFLLLRSLAEGQLLPTLQITNNNGNAGLSWSGGSSSLYGMVFLQTTANLTPPVPWTDLSPYGWTGNTSVPMDEPQQFFRLAVSLPIFQFEIFYNLDLEIDPGGDITITGPVWSNGGIWSGSTTLTFTNTVSAVGLATNGVIDPFCAGFTGNGHSHYSLAGQPTSGNGPLMLTVAGTNTDPAATEALINLPPTNYAMGTAAAYSSTGSVYLANDVDLFLTNFPNGTNWMVKTPKGTNVILYYQDAANTPYLTRIPYDFYLLTNRSTQAIFSTNRITSDQFTNIWYAGYSFVTNAIFYDWREGWNGGNGIGGRGKAVQAVQIDIALFNLWLTNGAASNNGTSYNTQCKLMSHKAHPIDSIFVYNAVPLTSTTLPAVRVANGGKLPAGSAPNGFTLVTPMPLYVWGNYNVSNNGASSLDQNGSRFTMPAALMADAITILSTNWNDAITNKLPNAANTGVNAALLGGIVPSTNGIYSGGYENFPRFLENWYTDLNFWYHGSFVAMFPSQYATNSWQPAGNYYKPPAFDWWAFDTNFVSQAGLPPLTPTVENVVTP